MVKKPTVSVVLASYNHVEFIEKAIRSVLDQTFKDLELIIIDDGSTDGTVEVISKIKDGRIRFIRLKNNRAVHPRNLGLSFAQGEYIAFQNSDDQWLDTKLEKQLKVFKGNNNLTACFSTIEIIDENGSEQRETWAKGIFRTDNLNQIQWLRRLFDFGNCLAISSALVKKKDILKLGGFRESLVQLSDYDLWVRLAGLGNFFIIPENLTQIRIIGQTNFSAPTGKVLRRNQIEFAEVLARYLDTPVSKHIHKIFKEIMISDNSSELNNIVSLIKYAWKIQTPYHRLFANNAFGKLIDDRQIRKKIVKEFGSEIIIEYIENKASLEFFLKNLL